MYLKASADTKILIFLTEKWGEGRIRLWIMKWTFEICTGSIFYVICTSADTFFQVNQTLDTDMEKAMLSCDITTKVLVK